jgi:hypothetical protein
LTDAVEKVPSCFAANFRRKTKHATIDHRYALRPVAEVTDEVAALTAQKICVQRCKRAFQQRT